MVAGDAGDRKRAPEERGVRRTVDLAAVANLRQQRARHADEGQQLLIPVLGVNVEQKRARGVGDVGRVHAPARQAPQEKAIHRAERQLAALGA